MITATSVMPIIFITSEYDSNNSPTQEWAPNCQIHSISNFSIERVAKTNLGCWIWSHEVNFASFPLHSSRLLEQRDPLHFLTYPVLVYQGTQGLFIIWKDAVEAKSLLSLCQPLQEDMNNRVEFLCLLRSHGHWWGDLTDTLQLTQGDWAQIWSH